ncbi:MAG: hypothetical protein IT262_01000 [Saprospiraceae bacterium]|nr:hypothetical protein [Saprospiraceae bacterium]
MKALEFYVKMKALQQLFVKKPANLSYLDGYFHYWGLHFEPKIDVPTKENQLFNFIEGYKIPPYTEYLFYNIELLDQVFYEYEFATFAKIGTDYVSVKLETNQVMYVEFCDYHEMGLCAASPEQFLDVMYLLAERDTMRVLGYGFETDDAVFLEKVIEASGDVGTTLFYRYILSMLEN